MAQDVESGQAQDLMRVDVLTFDHETWVHVSSSSVVDWPTARDTLSPEVLANLIGRPAYFPSRPASEDYSFADWWVFGTTSDKVV